MSARPVTPGPRPAHRNDIGPRCEGARHSSSSVGRLRGGCGSPGASCTLCFVEDSARFVRKLCFLGRCEEPHGLWAREHHSSSASCADADVSGPHWVDKAAGVLVPAEEGDEGSACRTEDGGRVEEAHRGCLPQPTASPLGSRNVRYRAVSAAPQGPLCMVTESSWKKMVEVTRGYHDW